MNKHNTYTAFLIFFLIIILSERSSAAHYQYEACEPVSCGTGPNISFPFHIKGVQESYCGYPGFEITCKDTTPVLSLSENEYVVEDIFYQNRSLRVFDAALLGSNGSGCLPRMRNLTLPQPQFSYANETVLHLFSNCENLSEGFFSRYFHGRCGGYWNNGSYALYDGDENVGVAMEDCEENVVVPVDGFGSVVSEVLRRGFVMKWRASDCSVCHDSGGFCGFNETSFHFRCFCPDRPHLKSCKPEKTRLKLMLAISLPGLAVLLLLSVSIFILWKKKKKIEGSYLLSRNASSNTPKQDVESGSVYFGIPVFSYKELEEATHSFDQSKELGDGGFGTVYYGKLKDGREVAIKRLYEHNYRRMEQFLNEIKILTSLRHPNLVSLYGCTSRTSRELLLVYEYIPNGTVADHLHGERAAEAPLSWPVRMSIAIETATALSYLHKSDIIHRDVKTNNILLDSKFSVKVADFGLSRLFPNNVTHISTAPQGTPGYVDPEYHQFYQLTDKSDVYSFGVVLIELISSMPPVDVNRHRHEINLANLALNRIQRCAFDELIDPSLGYDSDPEVTRMTTTVAELAFRCLQVDKDLRPCMDEVLSFLKDIQGGNCGVIKEGNSNDNHSKIIASPETEDSVLLRNKKFQPSPTAVIDTWVSSASTTTTSFT